MEPSKAGLVPSGTSSPAKSPGSKRSPTPRISSQLPGGGALLYIPGGPMCNSSLDYQLAQESPSALDPSSPSNLLRPPDYTQSISSLSPASSPSKKHPSPSSTRNNINSPRNQPHQFSSPKSRPGSSSSRFSRQNAREADVLGKILGWRQSRTLRTTNSFKLSPNHPKQPYLRPDHRHQQKHSPSEHRIKPTSPQELPEIFRPSIKHSSATPLNTLPSGKLLFGDHLHPNDFQTGDHKSPNPSRPYYAQQSSSDLTSSTHTSSNFLSSVTQANSSQTSFNQLHPSSPHPSSPKASQLASCSDGVPSHPHNQSHPGIKLPVLRRPLLKKSFSSGQLNQHYNLPHPSRDPPKPNSQPESYSRLPQLPEPSTPLASPALLPEISNKQPVALDRPISLATPDDTELMSPAVFSQHPKPSHSLQHHQRFSLPAMHAILDANSSLSQMIHLDHAYSDDSDHSVQLNGGLTKHPPMHGVASNESIRTAKPNTEFDSSKPLPRFLPLTAHQSLPEGDHPTPSPDHNNSAASGRPLRFQNPRVFDLFVHNHRRDSTDLLRRLLSPELPGSSTPSETSSTQSHFQSLGASVNPSLNSSNFFGSTANVNSPLNKDPRFVIWAESPSSAPRQQPLVNAYPASRKRSSATVETRHYSHHPASASTSHLGIDHSTGRLTHAPSTSFGLSSPSGSNNPKRWSRSSRTPTSHHSHVETTSNPSPHQSTDAHHLRDDNAHGRSREELPHTQPKVSPGIEHTPKLATDHILMAATIERWVAELTTHIDSLGLVEFFFTYRAIMKPTQLAQLLASRFEWSIMFRSTSYAQHLLDSNQESFVVDSSSEKGILGLDGRLIVIDHNGETLRRVAKVRTFVMIRHWLLHHFEDDFLADVSLQTELHNWLENTIEKIKRVQRIISRLDEPAPLETDKSKYHAAGTSTSFDGGDDLRILKNLRKVFKELQSNYHQSFDVDVRDQQPASIREIDPSEDDDQKRSSLNRKLHKVDVRELFKESDGRDQQTSARRNRRSHTADLIDVPKSLLKKNLGHGRANSVNTLAQVSAANFGRSDLRLCELDQKDLTNAPGVLHEEENSPNPTPEVDPSKAEEKLILKLKQVFESDTRRHRADLYHKFIQKEADLDPSRFSVNRTSHSLPMQQQRQLMISRMRTSDGAADMPKSHMATQARMSHSNHPSAPFNQGGSTFLQHHSPFHRYFTSTMGTIGRFKRMINNRSGPHTVSGPGILSHHLIGGNASGLDFSSPSLSRETGSHQDQQPDTSEIGDLLCAKGGLERYLSFFEIEKDNAMASYDEQHVKDSIQVQRNSLSTAVAPLETNSAFESLGAADQTVRSPVQYDDCSESQLSLSSSLSNTTCTTQSMPSETEGDMNSEAPGGLDPVVVSVDVSGEQQLISKSNPDHDGHLLHGSMSSETIKSEAHHLALAEGEMDILKKQLRQKFSHKDMCPVLMRASLDGSFSGTVPEHSTSLMRHSEESPRFNTFSISVSSPNGEKDLAGRPTSVQLDDLDLFDSDEDSPVGVQKLRRLPGAVDLKQAIAFGRKSLFNLKGGLLRSKNEERSKRFSTETSSSIGTRRVPSIAGSMFRRSKLSHKPSIANSTTSSIAPSTQESSLTEQNEPDNGTPGVVANFVADGLESDDDEPGDVEAALRRLEGVIDADREKEKAKKVELQMIKSMEASRRTRTFSHTTSDSRDSYSSQTDDIDELETCSESADGDDVSEESDEDGSEANNHDEDEESEDGQEEEDGKQEEDEDDGNNEEKTVEYGEVTISEHNRRSKSILLDRSTLDSPIAEGDEDDDTKFATTPNLSPNMRGKTEHSKGGTPDFSGTSSVSPKPPILSPSNHTPSSKPGIRFFTAHSKGLSLDDLGITNDHSEDHNKTLRGNRKRLATRSQQVMTRKGSLHKLFSATNNNPPKSKGSTLTSPPLLAAPSSPYNNSVAGKPSIMHSLPLPPLHRSFLLDCRTEILAQQFCLIERDLLRNITWQELLLSKWQDDRSNTHHHGNTGNNGTIGHNGRASSRRKKGGIGSTSVEDAVTCWETFMKQRAKEKMRMKGRIQSHQNLTAADNPSPSSPPTTKKLDGTEINALIMRFNLTCNWVASELVLTINLDERVALLGKFIRLAFKCYRQNNFQTLTQIIHGLQTPYVERLKKTWSKLGIWESRMFRDLKEFTSHLSNFKSLRNVQDSLINESSSNLSSSSNNNQSSSTSTFNNSTSSSNANHPNTVGNATGVNGSNVGTSSSASHFLHNNPDNLAGGGGSNSRTSHTYARASNSNNACIPFLGLYLRDLTVNDELPTYLDPTDPSIPVEIDYDTGKLTRLSNPKVFDHLPSLPPVFGPSSIKKHQKEDNDHKKEEEGLEEQENSENDYGYYPLININKLRTYAKIILKIIEFQNRSIKNYTFETDSKWFLTCLKIKCLSSEQLKLLSRTCEP
ncbi:hypothetical protein MJO28_009664 [Puccinia striiformis f. sp. tritici]|uniref:Uncharacterized protein n=1 Tax=Puccinia striiformis f. sp. tritici TaxID=168172 RepID=A0ACC0E9Y2_9BASI|nr:hypothetical protein MJO28_009664 [Puccinia striiformis f. sp. tritici]